LGKEVVWGQDLVRTQPAAAQSRYLIDTLRNVTSGKLCLS